MRVRSTILAALAVVTSTTSAFGQTSTTTTPPNGGPVATAPSPAPSNPRVSIVGSTAGFRYRNQHNNANTETIDTTQVLLDMQVALRLDKDNKWKVISRIKTGPTFLQPWVDDGIVGDKPMNVHGFSMRQLYVEHTGDGYQADVGFMPVLPNADINGTFAYAGDGWLDGARFAKLDLAKWAKRVTVSVGRIDDLNSPAIADRGVKSPNTIIVSVQGAISDKIGYALEGSSSNPNGPVANEQWMRGMLNIATKDVVKFIDKVALEAMVQNSSNALQGVSIGATKVIDTDWSLTGTYSVKGQNLASREAQYGQRSYFYRQGHQATAQIQRTYMIDKHALNLQLWLGKTLRARNVAAGKDQAYGLINTKGLNVETRAIFKF